MPDNLPTVNATGYSFDHMMRLAEAVAKSNMFGMKTAEQALVLMAISEAEGRHPALAARDYDIIQGKPAKKAEAMQRDFLAAGGKIEWHALDDTKADATFSHPQGGTARIAWDMKRVQTAGINNPMWKKYPRQMLRSRVVSEGARTVFPAATSGMYLPEEQGEIVTPAREPIDVTPHDPDTGEIIESEPTSRSALQDQGERHAALGSEDLRQWYLGLDRAEKKAIKPYLDGELKQRAIVADNKMLDHSELEPPSPDDPAEQPAEASSDAESPQAEPQEDAFGLEPLSDDEAFCANILRAVKQCATLEAIDNVKLGWAKGGQYEAHMNRLPSAMWSSLATQIGEYEKTLPKQGEAA